MKLDWRYGFFELLIVVAGVMIALSADGLIEGNNGAGTGGESKWTWSISFPSYST